MGHSRELADAARAWPFEEARKVVARVDVRRAAGTLVKEVLFETGYGPSGLPHIGTFGEVARTSWVRQAFEALSEVPTRLIAFSDDMDGLRKVPDNVPNQDMLRQHLGKPLTAIPDPFGTHDSFGAHNNARLKAFLDRFGFRYEFLSSTECYKSGRFDAALLTVLRHYEKVRDVVLPTLGPERRATYSPFLPLCPRTGQVLQVPIVEWNADTGTIVYEDEGRRTEVPVTGGHCKLQWKADWAMRWFALSVDYEMSGKDLIPSVELSTKIVRVLGGKPPETFTYELFLDEGGQKISKSKGNGLSVDEWLTYGPEESLALFMFGKPHAAKKLYFDAIPKAVDEYIAFAEQYQRSSNEPKNQLENPAWFIHGGESAVRDLSGQFRAALESRQRFRRAGPRGAVGLHPLLRAGRRCQEPSRSRPSRDLCAEILRGLRSSAEALSRTEREGARSAGSTCRRAREHGGRTQRRDRAERGL